MHRILYHMDSDGHAACAVVCHKLLADDVVQDDIAFHPINYGMPIPKEIDYEKDNVYMVDFSLQPLEVMVEFAEKLGERLYWIDHHSTSVEMEDEAKALTTVPGVRQIAWDDGVPISGCELTWKYFYGTAPMPEVLTLVGDWDTWRWKDTDAQHQEDVQAFQYFLRSANVNPRVPTGLLWWLGVLGSGALSLSSYTEKGRDLLKYQQKQWKGVVGSLGFVANFQGLRAVMVNQKGNSEMFKDFFDPEKHDVMVCFQLVRGEYVTISMYTMKTDLFHVGNLCKSLGEAGDKPSGGGHAGAAGFQCSWEYFRTLYTVTGNFDSKK